MSDNWDSGNKSSLLLQIVEIVSFLHALIDLILVLLKCSFIFQAIEDLRKNRIKIPDPKFSNGYVT